MGFNFKELAVWRKAVEFADKIIETSEKINTDRKHFRLIENIEAAAASIPANIAEGKGRYSRKEFIQFLYIARGSLYEVVTYLEVFKKRKWITESENNSLVTEAEEIARMINGLIKSVR